MKRKRLQLLLALLITAATGAWAQQPTYSVKMKDGTKDAKKWTITSGQNSVTGDKADGLTGLNPKDAVTLKYGGRLKVKSVTATHDGWNGDLSSIPASVIQDDGRTVIVPDGITLKGKLDVSTIPYEIVIPAGATVTLAGVTIEGTSVKDDAHKHAGITCQGNATIILKDDTENTVTGFHENYPGIYVPEGKTLIIQGGKEGNGKLTASSNGAAAGIGAGYAPRSCGNIDIQGGDITATGDWSSAGIGGGPSSVCGTITISGGTVTATGGEGGAGIGSGNGYGANCGNITISGGTVKATSTENGAGIGSGLNATCGDITISGGTVEATATYNGAGIGSGLFGTCGNITITDDVALVMATKGEYAPYSIGKGYEGSCGTVTIGGVEYWKNNYAVGDGATYLAQPKIVYPKWDGDLSKLTAQSTAEFATATDGMTIKGTLGANVKVSIADGATVTLDNATINGVHNTSYRWAGINCLGDATIVLKDGTVNKVKGFHGHYPGIHVPEGSTLIIQGGSEGTGKLTATSNDYGAGIGGGYNIPCGNISITGGIIVVPVHASHSAGIGGGGSASCGYISITGGTVEATGAQGTAAIGSGDSGSCGTITIASTVTKVTANRGSDANYTIGKGNFGTCGTVTIGGTVYWQNNAAVNAAAATYLKQATLEFVNLAKLTGNYEAKDNTTLFGQLDGETQPYKITIADGATVTLAGVTILGTNEKENNTGLYPWAGITCAGDAIIVLKDATENTVTGFYENYPGIHVPEGKKLTIQGGSEGTGSLTASSNGWGAGIGGGYKIPCGDIEIQGGTVAATGGKKAAGIGSGYGIGNGSIATCGAITITGGTVTATGGENAAGIGSGEDGTCGTITIASTVKKVTATKGSGAPHSIGLGFGGTCGTVTIGGSVTDGISQSTYTYQP